MKKNKPGITAFLGAVAFVLFIALKAAGAETSAVEGCVTRDVLDDAMTKIEARLSAIEENQKKIIEGQKHLSEEHQQLRYWIHRN